MATKTKASALDHDCGSDRVETFNATAPDGTIVHVTRCTWCGAQTTEATGDNAGTEVGVAMLPGDGREPVGPEDALGVGPKRGDYTGRGGDLSTTQHFEGREAQNARVDDIGDLAGRKGGVTTS